MKARTAHDLPEDHFGSTGYTSHYARAEQMRSTEGWVLICHPDTRNAAYEAARRVRTGHHPAYAGRRYEAVPVTTRSGRHQVWGRYVGEVTR